MSFSLAAIINMPIRKIHLDDLRNSVK